MKKKYGIKFTLANSQIVVEAISAHIGYQAYSTSVDCRHCLSRRIEIKTHNRVILMQKKSLGQEIVSITSPIVILWVPF